MSTPTVNVNIIRCFDGWRNERLHLIWDCVAEYMADKFRLCWFPNPGARLSHAQALNAIWSQELERSEPLAIIVEHDFLPNLSTWPATTLLSVTPAMAPRYVTRHPESHELVHWPIPGMQGFFMADKTQIGALDFSPLAAGDSPWITTAAKKHNDPGNSLDLYIKSTYGFDFGYIPQTCCLPWHYGTRLGALGEHLYWARHLHDDPNMRISGMCLGDVQRLHDRTVAAWLETAPADFRDLYRKRSPARAEEARGHVAVP